MALAAGVLDVRDEEDRLRLHVAHGFEHGKVLWRLPMQRTMQGYGGGERKVYHLCAVLNSCLYGGLVQCVSTAGICILHQGRRLQMMFTAGTQ